MGMMSGIGFLLLLFVRPQPKDRILIDFVIGRKKVEDDEQEEDSQPSADPSPKTVSATPHQVKVDIKTEEPAASE